MGMADRNSELRTDDTAVAYGISADTWPRTVSKSSRTVSDLEKQGCVTALPQTCWENLRERSDASSSSTTRRRCHRRERPREQHLIKARGSASASTRLCRDSSLEGVGSSAEQTFRPEWTWKAPPTARTVRIVLDTCTS